jgi:cytosine/adenosine deaminase-related metal-dependent hydrolase
MRLLVEAGNAAVGVERGRIVEPRGRFDAVLRLPDGELRPGLINAHDHLHRNHYGRLGHPPYADAYEWGRDIHARDESVIAAGRALPRREALLRGAWTNLRAGVTTVVHHDAWEPAFDDGFPLRVARVRCAHSPRLEPALERWRDGAGPLAIHLAEGVNAAAAAEVRELESCGLLGPKLLAVHVVGADEEGVRRLRESGAAVVWCPTSNRFLFGRTAPPALLGPGMDVLLGSDSLLTGAGTLLDELRQARTLGLLSDERLVDAVGAVAARRLGLAKPSLLPGARADLLVLRRPLLEADAADVALVIAGGVPRVLDPALVPVLGSAGSAGRLVALDGVVRWVCDQPPEPSCRGARRPDRPAGLNDTRPASSRRRRP